MSDENSAPDEIAMDWEPGKAITSGPLFADPNITHWVRKDISDAAVEAAKREAVAPYEQLARDVVTMIDEMSSVALLIGLEGTSDWDKVAGGAGIFTIQDRARDLLKEDTDNEK